jgi:hypothetical protein
MFGHRSFLMLGGDSPADIRSLTKGGYEILDCRFSLEQGMHKEGKVSTRVYASAVEIVLSQFPTDEILEWGIKNRKYKDGMIVLLDANNIPVEKIIFKNAACTRLMLSYIQTGKSYASVKMMIQPEELLLGTSNDIFFTNEWTDY